MLNYALIGVTYPKTRKLIAFRAGFLQSKLNGPKGVSTAVLVAVFGVYAAHWLHLHGGFLFVPSLQNDDARTALFPFHRYGMNPWLAHDPIAREMMAYVTPGLWILYRCLVPLTNLYVASKCVQALALGVLVVSGCILALSRRAGLAAGLLLIFLVLSDSYAIGRIAGGHARAFAFPCFALWVAGVLSRKRWARIAAPLFGSLFYPALMLMIIAAEAFYSLRNFWRLRLTVLFRRFRRYALLTIACFVMALPSVLGGDKARGPIHTLQQAAADPAFYAGGQLWVLPLGKPADELIGAFLTRFSASGRRPIGGSAPSVALNPAVIALVVLSFIAICRGLGWVSISSGVAAFLLGSVALYFAARYFAFRLYSTERYYAYCMRMAACLLLVAVASRFGGRRRRSREWPRNLFATAIILGQWIVLGDGIIPNNGMTLDARSDADLYEFIRTLPATVRFASHPMDGDGIPYFAARATMGTFETLQPWFVDSWRRQKAREYATLDALYCTNLRDLLTYGSSYSVSHFLVNRDRYGSDYKQHIGSFEPFTAYLNHLVSQPNRAPPALTRVPDSAIVFDRPPWLVLDLERLRQSIGNYGNANLSADSAAPK